MTTSVHALLVAIESVLNRCSGDLPGTVTTGDLRKAIGWVHEIRVRTGEGAEPTPDAIYGAIVRRDSELQSLAAELSELRASPVPMLLCCPSCNTRHIDEGEFATKPHHTHACQSCGMVWRPAIAPTVGVVFLPGFKNAPSDTCTWPGCTEPSLCSSGNFNNQLVCRNHFMRTNGVVCKPEGGEA